MVSSPRFSTSFHAKEIVYPSFKAGSQNHSHHTRSASELKYRSPEATSHRKLSACSLAVSGDLSCYKTFQDPVQKTYSGDLLQTHSQHFTQDKPFTPKTLKSNKSSCLSKYRYYRAPRRNPTQDCANSRVMRQETYHGRYLVNISVIATDTVCVNSFNMCMNSIFSMQHKKQGIRAGIL